LVMTDELGASIEEITYYTEPPCYLNGMSIRYTNNLYIVVYFSKLQYQNNFIPGCKWDNELLKNEKVIGIKVVYSRMEVINSYLPEFLR